MPLLPLAWDIDQRSWYAPYAEVAFEQGVLELSNRGAFRPSDALTYAEAVAMRARSLQVVASPASADAVLVPTAVSLLTQAGVRVPVGYEESAAISRDDFLQLLAPPAVSPSADVGIAQPAPVVLQAVTDVREQSPFAVASAPVQALTAQQQEYLQFASRETFAITMPTLGIRDLRITHPQDPTTNEGVLAPLEVGVGHLFSYPGSQSTVLLYGHSSNWPWDVSGFARIFRQINQLAIGDRLYVTYNGKLYVYAVTSKETIPATDFSSLRSNGDGEQLILYTCWPPDDISERYIVRAAPVDVILLQ